MSSGACTVARSLRGADQVDPKEYGPNLKKTIEERLQEVVENTCNERYGFILKVCARRRMLWGARGARTGVAIWTCAHT